MTIHDASDLKERSVGVTPGGFPRKFLETQPRVHLVLINNYRDGFDQLAAGTIDAMAADLWVAAYLIEKGGIRDAVIVGKPFATAQGAIAVKKGNLALLDEINRAINALKAEGRISKIQNDRRPQEMVFASRERIEVWSQRELDRHDHSAGSDGNLIFTYKQMIRRKTESRCDQRRTVSTRRRGHRTAGDRNI
jgi:hypothetical protein